MNDTIVTVVGNVADWPRRKVNDGTSAVTNFRMASTARRYDTGRQEFVDSGTFWIDVECWNDLAGNVASSVSKGDPVIVQGAITTRSWETEDGRRSLPRIRAFAVGPNLARGSALFRRSQPLRPAAPAEDGADPGALPGAGDAGRPGATPEPAGPDYPEGSPALHGADPDETVAEAAFA